MRSKTPQKRVLFARTPILSIVGLLSVALLLLTTLVISPHRALAATSNTINFQARLEDNAGGIVPDGYYNISFHLFDATTTTSGSTTDTTCNTDPDCLWAEKYTYNSGSGSSDARIRVANGYLTVDLGSATAFPSTINWDQNLYLSMDIGGTSGSSVTWDGQMSPRLHLTAVPYAFRARELATGNGTYQSTLSLVQPTAGNQTFQLPDLGVSGNNTYGLLALQNTATPVQQTSANFNIDGVGEVGSLGVSAAGAIDTTSAGSLNIGLTSGGHATQIDLNQNTQVAGTLAFATGGGGKLTLSPTSTASNFTITLPASTGTVCLDSGTCNSTYSKTATEIVAMGSTSCTTPNSVASNDTSAADYVASGCSADTAISSAISALPAGGGVVYLEEGTYIISSAITLPSNVTLEGAGANTILEFKNGLNTNISMLYSSSTVAKTVIKDLTLDGNKANQSSGGQYGINIFADTTTGVTIDHVWAKNFYTDGIDASYGNYTIENTSSTNNAQNGFDITGNNSSVTDSIAANNGWRGFNGSGTNDSYSGDQAISNTSTGLYVLGWDDSVTNCQAYNNSGPGIFVGSYSALTGSSSYNNTGDGIAVDGNSTVSGNSSYHNGAAGINADYSAYATITGNQISGNTTDGVDLFDGDHNIVSNNAITLSTGLYYGIYVSLSGHNTITDNNIIGGGGTGNAIYITGSSTTGNYLSGNTFSGTGATSINDADTSTVYGTQVTDTSNDMLQQATGITQTVGTGNYVLNGAAASTYAIGAATTTGTITVGGTGMTGSLTVGNYTGSGTSNLYVGNGATTGTQNIAIGTGATGSGADTVTIGSTNGSSATTIQGGTGGINLYVNGGASATSGVLIKPTTNDSTAAFQIQNSSGSVLFTADTTGTHIIVGNTGPCTGVSNYGKFCVGQNVTGAANGTTANVVSDLNTTGGGSTVVSQKNIVSDTSSSVANNVTALLLDASSTTNTSAILNSIQAIDPAANVGNLLDLQSCSGGSCGTLADVVKVTNTGATTFANQTNSTTAFQVQDASGTNMLNVNTDNELINDDMVADAPSGTLVNGASWVSGQYVELDNGGPGVDGEVNYLESNVGNSFDAKFDFWSVTGGGDGTWLYTYDTSQPGSYHYGDPNGGYEFAYSDTDSKAEIYFNGSLLASASISAPNNSTWHTGEVVKSGDTMTMYYDGTAALTYTDSTARSLTGTYFGLGGCSCGSAGEHRAKNFSFISDAVTLDPFTQFNSGVNVSGQAIVGTLTAGTGDSSNDQIAIRGTSYSNIGVDGISTSSMGVYGYSNSYVGVYGQSQTGTSGLFQANSGSNTAATLVTQQQGSGTANLFEAQDSTGSTLLDITSGGSLGIGVAVPAVALDVNGAIQQTGMTTPNTGASDANYWTELGSCTINSQYQRCMTKINIIGGSDGGAQNSQSTVTARVKQQNAMGGAPVVNVTVNDTAEFISASNIVAVTTENDATATVVQLWGQIPISYENWYYAPVLNIPDYATAGWVWSPNSTLQASLPSGTQTAAVYGDSFANTLTVQDSSDATYGANEFQVLNASGTDMLNVDSNADTVTMLQNAQVSTFNDGQDNYAFTLADSFASPTYASRFRVNVYGANLESAATNFYISGFANANFTGTQTYFLLGDIAKTALYVGNENIVSTPTVLVLDNGNSSDPTEINGAMYYNSSESSFRCGQNGAWVACDGLVAVNTTPSNAITNTTSQTNFSGGNGSTYTIPANDCQPGVTYLITARGWYDTTGTPTISWHVLFGSTELMASGDMPTRSNVTGEGGWKLEATLVCDTTGSSGTVEAQGDVMQMINSNGGGAGNGYDADVGMMSDTSAQTMNTTASNVIHIAAKWSAASSSNKLEMRQLIVQRLGPD
jgi:parallel beta-helix repeat protein